MMGDIRLICADATEGLRALPSQSVQMCVTSPPYFGLRDYGTASWDGGAPNCDHRTGRDTRGGVSAKQNSNGGSFGDEAVLICPKCGARRVDNQIGLEETPEEYVQKLVAVFREVRRVLRDDGTLWLNIGDSYGGSMMGRSYNGFTRGPNSCDNRPLDMRPAKGHVRGKGDKQLLGIPWRLAFALQDDGWVLRSDIIWAKPNPMPESVKDRPTKAHEYLFLFAKQPKYFYDSDAIREPLTMNRWSMSNRLGSGNRDVKTGNGAPGQTPHSWERKGHSGYYDGEGNPLFNPAGRNARSVWTICPASYKGAHFATFPERLVERCIKAGSSERGQCPICGKPWARLAERAGTVPQCASRKHEQTRLNAFAGQEYQDWKAERPDTTVGWRPGCAHDAEPISQIVLDPFNGAGTAGVVCARTGRSYIGIDLNPGYIEMSHDRIAKIVRPLEGV